MQIRLAGDASRYLVLDRSMMDDPRLSFRAKGLLAYLLSLPESSSFEITGLAAVSTEGRGAIETALKELEDAGYCRQMKEPDEGGVLQPIVVVYSSSRVPLLESQRLKKLLGSRNEGAAPSSTRSEQDESSAPAQRIIDRLNELRKQAWDWARYTPLSGKYAKNVEHINGRLGDGYAESDLILVLEYLAAIDGGKEESRKYFDCVTPFNTKHFERNLAMARDWEARGRPQFQSTSKHQYEQSHDPSIYDRGRRGGQQ